jgi:hypothetical protein
MPYIVSSSEVSYTSFKFKPFVVLLLLTIHNLFALIVRQARGYQDQFDVRVPTLGSVFFLAFVLLLSIAKTLPLAPPGKCYAARCALRRLLILAARKAFRATALLCSLSWELYTSVTRPRRLASRIGSTVLGFAFNSTKYRR